MQAFSVPGYRNPAHATATGKILLAYQPQHVIDTVCAKPQEQFTDMTETDPHRLREELGLSRMRGYAINIGGYVSDVSSIAAVVLDPAGNPHGCVAVTVPGYRLSPERCHQLAEQLLGFADDIAQELDMLNFGVRTCASAEGPAFGPYQP